ncbi:MAG TPA: PhzF family phenazine biosynthesis protein [Candidatus Limnocylindrales bacterium]|nr:PhzF family phenazine biosynthesis protein [Candidatus Limnocylindrales bacterium]
MRRRFVTCDVFTETRFGGNPLAVVLDAEGLSDAQMQQVAREFNYSETTFVLPAEQGHDRRVRIFTPAREVPFAGHPNVGTAFALASIGELGPLDDPLVVVFEEGAGLVPVTVRRDGDRIWCELRAPAALSLGPALPVAAVADAVGLTPQDIALDRHAPRVASVGLEFVVAELADRSALERARPDSAALERLLAAGAATADIHVYVPSAADDAEGFDLRTRMFAPFDGVPEDPATGSANCALVGLLASLDRVDGNRSWRIAQGVEMGRPSVLDARVRRVAGEVAGVWIGGGSVLVSEGMIEV